MTDTPGAKKIEAYFTPNVLHYRLFKARDSGASAAGG
jgi:hypothetical protein